MTLRPMISGFYTAVFVATLPLLRRRAARSHVMPASLVVLYILCTGYYCKFLAFSDLHA